jgi:hypothetical protein
MYVFNKTMPKALIVKPIPVPTSSNHPPPPNDVLPKHEFTIGIIAPKGSGKTTVIANLLQFYRGYFHTILIFSPTVASDEKWDYVKKQRLLIQNKPLKKWVDKLKAKDHDNKVVDPPPPSAELQKYVEDQEDEEDFDGTIPEDHFMSDYDEQTLSDIMNQQMTLVKTLKAHGKTKHLANRILIVFDDLVGSSLFSGKKDNPFKRLNTNHRHYSCSILMVTQAYMEIPKTVRTQFSCVILFEIANEREVDVVYAENPMGLKQNDWLEIYHYATEGDHDFMFINYQKPKRLRIMKNFQQVLFVD